MEDILVAETLDPPLVCLLQHEGVLVPPDCGHWLCLDMARYLKQGFSFLFVTDILLSRLPEQISGCDVSPSQGSDPAQEDLEHDTIIR